VLSPQNALSHGDLNLHLIHASLGSPESIYTKRHLDRFSRFCTDHARVSSGICRGMLFPLRLPIPMGRLDLMQYTVWFIEPTGAHNPNGISIGSAVFAQLTAHCRRARLDMSFPLKIALRMGIWTPSNKCFLGFTRVYNLNAISSGSAVFAHHDRACLYFTTGSPSPQTCAFP